MSVLAACGSAALLWKSDVTVDQNTAQYVTDVTLDEQGNRYVSGARQTFWGESDEPEPFAGFDPFITKINDQGETVWTVILPTEYERNSPRIGSGYDEFYGALNQSQDYSGGEEVADTLVTPEGIYVLAQVLGAGFNTAPDSYDLKLGYPRDWDVKLYKLSLDGNIVWQRVLEQTEEQELPRALKATADGELVVLLEHWKQQDSGSVLLKLDAEGDIQWRRPWDKIRVAVGVSSDAILLAASVGTVYDADSQPPYAVAVELGYDGQTHWESESLPIHAANSKVQPRCSDYVFELEGGSVQDIVQYQDSWVIASSRNISGATCAGFYLAGADYLTVFSRQGQLEQSIVIREPTDLDVLFGERPPAHKELDFSSRNLTLVTDNQALYLVGNLNRFRYVIPSEHAKPLFYTDVIVSKIDSDFGVQWQKKLHSPIQHQDNHYTAAYHRAVASRITDSGLMVASHVIKADYQHDDENLYNPDVESVYSRVHHFDANGNKKILTTLNDLMVRDMVTTGSEFSVVTDSAVGLGINEFNAFDYVDFSLVSDPITQPTGFVYTYQQ